MPGIIWGGGGQQELLQGETPLPSARLRTESEQGALPCADLVGPALG